MYFDGGVTDYVVGEVKCSIESNPVPIVEWFGPDREPLLPNGKYRISSKTLQTVTTSTLSILDLRQSDFGTYACEAENHLGLADTQMKVYSK